MTMEPWDHGTIEPLNETSQIAQEYGLLPAVARQQQVDLNSFLASGEFFLGREATEGATTS